jgi:hypothetical protein
VEVALTVVSQHLAAAARLFLDLQALLLLELFYSLQAAVAAHLTETARLQTLTLKLTLQPADLTQQETQEAQTVVVDHLEAARTGKEQQA